jgi:hypothetical protein
LWVEEVCDRIGLHNCLVPHCRWAVVVLRKKVNTSLKCSKVCVVTRDMKRASADSVERVKAENGATELFVLSLSNTVPCLSCIVSW